MTSPAFSLIKFGERRIAIRILEKIVTPNRFGPAGPIDTSVRQRTNTSIGLGPSGFLQHWHLCQCCAGVLACIALVSLQALCCHCCRLCAVVVAGVALALLPVSCWHLCPHCTGIAAFVAPALAPALQTGVCPTTMQPRHIRVRGIVVVVIFLVRGLVAIPGVVLRQLCPQWSDRCSIGIFASAVLATRAGVIVSIAPLLLPALHRHCCPLCAGIVTLVTFALLPASRTGVCSFMTQTRHVAGEASLPHSSSSLVALLL